MHTPDRKNESKSAKHAGAGTPTPGPRYSLGWSGVRALRRAAEQHGAGEAELASIDRLERFDGEVVDVERLRPLAELIGLAWTDFYPEVFAAALSLAESRR